MTLSKSNFDLESIAGGIYSNTLVNINNSRVNVIDGNYGIGVGQGDININDSTFKIDVDGEAFRKKPIISGLDNKIIYAGNEKDGSDAIVIDKDSDFDLSEYSYVRIANIYTIKVVADDNIMLDTDKEMTVIEGDNKELVIKAKDGYKIKSILVNDRESTLIDNKLVLTNIDEEMIIKVTSEKETVTAGEVDNPKTGDSIILYLIICLGSIIGLIGTRVLSYRKDN